MEIGAFFILILVVAVVGVLGGGAYLIAARLRQKQLHPQGDQVEGEPSEPSSQRDRPDHRRVENEQRTRFVGGRR